MAQREALPNSGNSSQLSQGIVTQNTFLLLPPEDNDGENNGGDLVCEMLEPSNSDSENDWTPVAQAKKRSRTNTGGKCHQSNNTLSFGSLSLDDKLSAMYSEMNNNKTMMENIESKLDKCIALQDKVNNLENTISAHESRITLLEYKSIDIEARSRRKNLLFGGFAESRDENCEDMIQSFLNETLRIHKEVVIDRAHRLGRFNRNHSRPRAIIVAFRDYADTTIIISKARLLRGTNYSINKDFPQEITTARKSIWGEYKDLRNRFPDSRVSIVYPAKIVKDGKVVRDAFPNWSAIMTGDRVCQNTRNTRIDVNKADDYSSHVSPHSTSARPNTQVEASNHGTKSMRPTPSVPTPAQLARRPRSRDSPRRKQSKSPLPRASRNRAPEREQKEATTARPRMPRGENQSKRNRPVYRSVSVTDQRTRGPQGRSASIKRPWTNDTASQPPN